MSATRSLVPRAGVPPQTGGLSRVFRGSCYATRCGQTASILRLLGQGAPARTDRAIRAGHFRPQQARDQGQTRISMNSPTSHNIICSCCRYPVICETGRPLTTTASFHPDHRRRRRQQRRHVFQTEIQSHLLHFRSTTATNRGDIVVK